MVGPSGCLPGLWSKRRSRRSNQEHTTLAPITTTLQRHVVPAEQIAPEVASNGQIEAIRTSGVQQQVSQSEQTVHGQSQHADANPVHQTGDAARSSGLERAISSPGLESVQSGLGSVSSVSHARSLPVIPSVPSPGSFWTSSPEPHGIPLMQAQPNYFMPLHSTPYAVHGYPEHAFHPNLHQVNQYGSAYQPPLLGNQNQNGSFPYGNRNKMKASGRSRITFGNQTSMYYGGNGKRHDQG